MFESLDDKPKLLMKDFEIEPIDSSLKSSPNHTGKNLDKQRIIIPLDDDELDMPSKIMNPESPAAIEVDPDSD